MDKRVAALDYTNAEYHNEFAHVINILNNDLSKDDLQIEFVRYAKSIDRGEDAAKVPKNNILTEGKIAYCLNRGAKLESRSVQKVIALLDEGSQRTDSIKELTVDDMPETAASRSIFAYSMCFSLIDNLMLKAANGKMSSGSIPDEVRSVIRKYADGKDKIIRQLEKHYLDTIADVNQSEYVNKWVKPLNVIMDTLQLMATNSRKPRKQRKNAKAKDTKAVKAAGRMAYKTSDDTLGIRSADPITIIGAAGVVLFNTKNRRCELYAAAPGQKLSIQGARISNYDEKSSTGKTIRNPEDSLPHWIRAGNLRRLSVLIGDVKGKEWEANGKLNKNTVILKVVQN